MPFVKIWTEMFNDPWFISLTCNQRGVWLQLILLAKIRGDVGIFYMRNYSEVAHIMGCDRGSLKKILTNFHQTDHIILKDEGKIHRIEIPKYLKWQELKVYNPRLMRENSQEKSHKSRADKSRADKSRADKSRADLNEGVSAPQKPKSEGTDTTKIKKYFRKKYQDKYNIDYNFKGAKDALIIKRLLKIYGLEKLTELVDSFYDTQIKFILDKGHSWGMFSSMLTQIITEAQNNNSPIMQLSEVGQKTAINLQKWMANKNREIENE